MYKKKKIRANVSWQWNPMFFRKGSALVFLTHSVINKEQPMGENVLAHISGLIFKAEELGIYVIYAFCSQGSEKLILFGCQENIFGVYGKTN